METLEISSYKARKKQKKNFLDTSGCLRVIHILKDLYKTILVVIFRGQPTLYDRRFTRYEKS